MSKRVTFGQKELLRLVICGMLIAVDVVLTRIGSVNLWDRRIGFSFVAVAFAAYLYGPIGGALVHGVADVIGTLLFPTGPYFPGYTLTAVMIGAVFGLCFWRSTKLWRIALAVVVTQLGCSIGLNTLWICITNHTPFLALLPGRVMQAAIMAPVQLIVIPLMLKALERGGKTILKQI